MEELPSFILTGFALAGSPGPTTLSLAAAGAAFGARRCLAFMGGVMLGMLGVIAITASGVTGVLLALPGATPVMAVLAACYFAYLAFRIASAPPLTEASAVRRHPSVAGGVVLSLVNPKAYAAMASLFAGFVLVRGDLGWDVAAKTSAVVGILIVVNVAWLTAGAALTRYLRAPRSNRIINVTFAVLLIGSVGFALLI